MAWWLKHLSLNWKILNLYTPTASCFVGEEWLHVVCWHVLNFHQWCSSDYTVCDGRGCLLSKLYVLVEFCGHFSVLINKPIQFVMYHVYSPSLGGWVFKTADVFRLHRQCLACLATYKGRKRLVVQTLKDGKLANTWEPKYGICTTMSQHSRRKPLLLLFPCFPICSTTFFHGIE